MTFLLPALSPEIPDGFVFVPQDEADITAIVTAAGDRVREIDLRPGYGVLIPADIATAAGVTATPVEIAQDVAAAEVPQPESAPEADAAAAADETAAAPAGKSK